jgi:hypothetical protein
MFAGIPFEPAAGSIFDAIDNFNGPDQSAAR